MTNFKNLDPVFAHMLGLTENLFRTNQNYPPFNVISTGDTEIRVEVAVAGFRPEDLSVELDGRALIITGNNETETEGQRFIHRGISNRGFTRRFALAEGWEIEDVTQDNGILMVSLRKNVPEKPEPRRFTIKTKSA